MKLIVPTTEGPQEVLAKIYGPLGIHRKPAYDAQKDPDVWALTHVQTGLELGQFPKDVAIALAESLKDLDWDFVDPRNAPRATRIAAFEAVQAAKAPEVAQQA